MPAGAPGVLLFSDYSIAELVELGQLCEALGYRSFWYTDVRFARECYIELDRRCTARHTRIQTRARCDRTRIRGTRP